MKKNNPSAQKKIPAKALDLKYSETFTTNLNSDRNRKFPGFFLFLYLTKISFTCLPYLCSDIGKILSPPPKVKRSDLKCLMGLSGTTEKHSFPNNIFALNLHRDKQRICETWNFFLTTSLSVNIEFEQEKLHRR